MQSRLKLLFVYRHGRNEKGYTLIELLLIISILSIFTSFLSVIIFQLKPAINVDVQERYEVSNFFIQLKKDLRTAQNIEIQPNQLCFYKETSRICYGLRGNRINRTNNNSGNNFGLLNVKDIKFTENEVGFMLEVWKMNNNYYYTQVFR